MKPNFLQEAHPDFSRLHLNAYCKTAFISCLPNTTCHSFIRHATQEHTWGMRFPFQEDFLAICLTSALSTCPTPALGAYKCSEVACGPREEERHIHKPTY